MYTVAHRSPKILQICFSDRRMFFYAFIFWYNSFCPYLCLDGPLKLIEIQTVSAFLFPFFFTQVKWRRPMGWGGEVSPVAGVEGGRGGGRGEESSPPRQHTPAATATARLPPPFTTASSPLQAALGGGGGDAGSGQADSRQRRQPTMR
jgi:hypothetical protein